MTRLVRGNGRGQTRDDPFDEFRSVDEHGNVRAILESTVPPPVSRRRDAPRVVAADEVTRGTRLAGSHTIVTKPKSLTISSGRAIPQVTLTQRHNAEDALKLDTIAASGRSSLRKMTDQRVDAK